MSTRFSAATLIDPSKQQARPKKLKVKTVATIAEVEEDNVSAAATPRGDNETDLELADTAGIGEERFPSPLSGEIDVVLEDDTEGIENDDDEEDGADEDSEEEEVGGQLDVYSSHCSTTHRALCCWEQADDAMYDVDERTGRRVLNMSRVKWRSFKLMTMGTVLVLLFSDPMYVPACKSPLCGDAKRSM